MNILPNFNFDINFKCAKQKAIKTSVKKPLGRHRLDISKKEISKCISSGYTIKQISEILHIDHDEMADIIYANTKRMLNK